MLKACKRREMSAFLARMRRKRRTLEDDDGEEIVTSSAAKKKKRSVSQDAGLCPSETPTLGAARRKKLSIASVTKIRRSSSQVDSSCKVVAFQAWCQKVGIELHPNLSIGREGSCADIGVVATGDISKGEKLAVIPRSALLTSTNSCLCLQKWAEKDKVFKKQLPKLNSWVPLLLALMSEYRMKRDSKWFPYLSLVPNNEEKGSSLPLLWSECEQGRLLAGTEVQEKVQQDLENMEKDFNTVILPFMKRHPELFRKTFHSFDLYKKLVSFVMSYSFTDPGEEDVLQRTMLVPFVDLLNHHSNHHAELNYRKNCLKLVAVRDIREGDEVMNTYGPLPNSSLLHTYGFAEPGNPHDVAYVTFSAIGHSYLGEKTVSAERETRWNQLVTEVLHAHSEGKLPHTFSLANLVEERYEVSSSGEPEYELYLLVKALLADTKHYLRLKEKLLSSDESSEDEEKEAMTDVSLGPEEIEFLRQVTEHCLQQFPESYESNLETASTEQMLMPRERHALHLCIGQQKCFLSLLERLS